MINLLIVLILILIMFIFLDCFIKERYFKDKNKVHYYRVLKNILSIFVMIFIILDRKHIISIDILGPFVIWCSIFMMLFNGCLLLNNINILKRENLL